MRTDRAPRARWDLGPQMPRSLRCTRQEHSEALTPQVEAGVSETWVVEGGAESLASGTLRPGRPGREGPGYPQVKGATGDIPASPAPPPRRQQQEMGDARLPRTVTMDSSRAGLCPGRPPSRPGLRDSAGCSSRRTRDGQTGCANGGLCGRDGGGGAAGPSWGSLTQLRPVSGAPRTGPRRRI